jgi:hypothetical protein
MELSSPDRRRLLAFLMASPLLAPLARLCASDQLAE